MIRTIKIENFKSIVNLEMDLGRVTVLIGANGSGKSNILEALAFASAAADDKLDNEFLASRGVRFPSNPRLLLPAFSKQTGGERTKVWVTDDKINIATYEFNTYGDNKIVPIVTLKGPGSNSKIRHNKKAIEAIKWTLSHFESNQSSDSKTVVETLLDILDNTDVLDQSDANVSKYLIYAPENRDLRTFTEEGQILPLGIHGEGLFGFLKYLVNQKDDSFSLLKEKMHLIDWFEDFQMPDNSGPYERSLQIRDKNLIDDLAFIDQRSANEGFLFLLFYFCLFLTDSTPAFFAIDNIDSSLNPKLCERLIQELVTLAADNNKQVILTTHNPAILDGLNLHDPEQKLYNVRRNIDGETRVSQIEPPKVREGETPVRLSEAYLRGYLGGLPTNF